MRIFFEIEETEFGFKAYFRKGGQLVGKGCTPWEAIYELNLKRYYQFCKDRNETDKLLVELVGHDMTKERILVCENCWQEIGTFYLGEIQYPITGAMFYSPDSEHEAPAPFHPSFGWQEFRCPHDDHSPFELNPDTYDKSIDSHFPKELLTSEGYIDIEKLLNKKEQGAIKARIFEEVPGNQSKGGGGRVDVGPRFFNNWVLEDSWDEAMEKEETDKPNE